MKICGVREGLVIQRDTDDKILAEARLQLLLKPFFSYAAYLTL